jgi:hypothetical protein
MSSNCVLDDKRYINVFIVHLENLQLNSSSPCVFASENKNSDWKSTFRGSLVFIFLISLM